MFVPLLVALGLLVTPPTSDIAPRITPVACTNAIPRTCTWHGR